MRNYNILFTNLFKRVWIVIKYFLFKKHAFNGLLKVIGIQIDSLNNKIIEAKQRIHKPEFLK